MEHSKSRGKERATLQAWSSETHGESQISVLTDLANMSSVSDQAGTADNNGDAINGTKTANFFDANTDSVQPAEADIGWWPKHLQVSSAENIKKLLRNFLDDTKEPQSERSSYCDGLLSQWLNMWRTHRTHPLLIYILGDGSEQYKGRELDISDLETVDRVKTDVLEQQFIQQGACLHLAKMTSAVNIDPDEAKELKMAISLHEIRDFNGGLLVNKPVAVGRESVMQEDLLAERYHRAIARGDPYPSPLEEKPTSQTDTAKSFQDWVLVIMPEGYRFKFLTDNADSQELSEWIKTQSVDIQPSKLDVAGTDKTTHWGLALACKAQLNNITTWLSSGLCCRDPESRRRQSSMLEDVVCASLRLRDPDLFKNAITSNPRMLSLTKWEEIGSTIELDQFSSYRYSLNQALTNIDSFQDCYIILHSLREGCITQKEPQESMTNFDNWFREHIEQALSDIEQVEENDGAVLVLVARKFFKTISTHRIIAFAKKHSHNYNFAIEFAFSLYDELVKNTIDEGQAKYLLAETLSTVVTYLCARGSHNWSLNPWFPYLALYDPPQDQQTLQADRMARLVRCCLTVGLYNEEHALLRHLWLDASMADAPTLQHVFLSYLKQLLVVMHDYRIPLTTPIYQWQFQHIISLFITRYIGKEPTPLSPDLTCPPLGCAKNPKNPYGCPPCLELDSFLQDPHRKTVDLTGGIDAPEHITAQIQSTDYLEMQVLSQSGEQMESTVRVTKNKAEAEEADARHDLWTARVFKANDLIQAVCRDEEWKLLLGDRYEECMGLKAVRGGD